MKNNRDLLVKIKQALADVPALAECLSHISVSVNDGAVVLSGTIDSAALKTLATEIVSAIPGVDYLIEEFRVEKGDRHRVAVQIDWAKGKIALK
ncbi:MAG TPA: BON domain-containing protein [Chryseolinea sp.]